jgi:Ca2+-binding EF-hand superfamily protein
MARAMKTAFIAAIGLVAITTPALAEETPDSAAAKFKKEFAATDTNHDGYWSRAEVAARIARMRVGNKRGDDALIKQRADAWFTLADRNKDGKVSEAEATALLRAMVKQYDANRDGRISNAEKTRAKDAMLKR